MPMAWGVTLAAAMIRSPSFSPIRVVRHDHQPAGGNLLNGGLDRIERWI